jgi:uncharacterized damage-inducible protein DinB
MTTLTTRGAEVTQTGTDPAARPELSQERADIIETLRAHRNFLRHTVEGLSDEQAAQRTTVSQLCLGGLVKHVSQVEANWVRFILEGPSAMPPAFDDAAMATYADGFRLLAGETLAGVLAEYDRVAARTDEMVASLDSLDASQALPEAPWFPAGARRSARRVFLHIVAETAQHAGHADIIRESLDGQKTMG